MTDALQPILARISLFADKTDLAITELSGGITNRNYKIEIADGEAYVLRVGGNDTNLLGIDRQVEYGCTLAASRVDVAPSRSPSSNPRATSSPVSSSESASRPRQLALRETSVEW